MSDNGSDLKKFECDVCHRWFARNNSLTEHKYIHLNRYPFDCEVCGKRFRQNSNLIKHRKLHRKSDPSYRCEVCGRVFAVHSYLKSHSLSHKQTKDNLCDKCGQTFKFKSDLIRHMKIHDNQRQYKCEVCLIGFNDKSALRRHTKRAHPIDKKTSDSEQSVRREEPHKDISDLFTDDHSLASVVDYINVCRILPVPLPKHIFEKLIEMQKQIGLELGLNVEAVRPKPHFNELFVSLKDLNSIVLEHLKSIESRL